MNLFAMMETSGGAMQAERMRAEVVAANMANAETTRTATGGAYHRQHVVFAANAGDPEFASTLSAASGNDALWKVLRRLSSHSEWF
jgi:flagellar basal-body rod protein FlgC